MTAAHPTSLLDPAALEASSVVANCCMNRARPLAGYVRELGVDPVAELRVRATALESARWLDLCCGTGRALIEAVETLATDGRAGSFQLEGVDLAGMFDPNPLPDTLVLRAQTIEQWTPSRRYALATCVHGLHYVGDKLAAIAKVVASLAPGGLFVANLDPAGIRLGDGRPATRAVAACFRKSGIRYDPRRRLLRCEGRRHLEFPFTYLGADDRVGPNYTGQSAVASYYEMGARR